MNIGFSRRKILVPNPDCPWAEKMVLNPAMISDPEDENTIYMLFRSTGAWHEAQIADKPAPYPIFLGFGASYNAGRDWEFDFSRPAMSPRLEYDEERFRNQSFKNGKMFDFANGCIEDPRLFYFENNETMPKSAQYRGWYCADNFISYIQQVMPFRVFCIEKVSFYQLIVYIRV